MKKKRGCYSARSFIFADDLRTWLIRWKGYKSAYRASCSSGLLRRLNIYAGCSSRPMKQFGVASFQKKGRLKSWQRHVLQFSRRDLLILMHVSETALWVDKLGQTCKSAFFIFPVIFHLIFIAFSMYTHNHGSSFLAFLSGCVWFRQSASFFFKFLIRIALLNL